MFDRFISLVGEDDFNNIKNKKIMVIGLGGVGGYVVESLVRCGIGNLVLVDFDIVSQSNINRQIIALKSTIGKFKTDVFYDRIMDINGDCNVTLINEKINEDNISLIKDLGIDFVVDACDDLKAKKLIIDICTRNNIDFISCMGTGKRLEPSKLEITTLNKTSYDPIARILRKYVKDNRIDKKIFVLASREIPIKNDVDFIPSCSFVPSSAGLFITSYIVRKYMKN